MLIAGKYEAIAETVNDKINITLLGHNLFDFYFVHVISYHTLRRFNVTSIINIMPFQVFY